MARYTGTVEAPHSPQEVWHYLADLRSVKEWDPSVDEVELVGGRLAGRFELAVPALEPFTFPVEPVDGAREVEVVLEIDGALEPATGGFWHDRAPRPEHLLRWTCETAADRERLWRECERLCTASKSPTAAPIC